MLTTARERGTEPVLSDSRRRVRVLEIVSNYDSLREERVALASPKAHRVSERKRQKNMPMRTRAKTFVARARGNILQGEMDLAEQAVKDAVVALDKAARKGVIHPNNAARRKSRLARQLNSAKSA